MEDIVLDINWSNIQKIEPDPNEAFLHLERPVSREIRLRRRYRVEIIFLYDSILHRTHFFSENICLGLEKQKTEQRKLGISLFIYKFGKYESCASILINNE